MLDGSTLFEKYDDYNAVHLLAETAEFIRQVYYLDNCADASALANESLASGAWVMFKLKNRSYLHLELAKNLYLMPAVLVHSYHNYDNGIPVLISQETHEYTNKTLLEAYAYIATRGKYTFPNSQLLASMSYQDVAINYDKDNDNYAQFIKNNSIMNEIREIYLERN